MLVDQPLDQRHDRIVPMRAAEQDLEMLVIEHEGGAQGLLLEGVETADRADDRHRRPMLERR
jgi:hypothetical protein